MKKELVSNNKDEFKIDNQVGGDTGKQGIVVSNSNPINPSAKDWWTVFIPKNWSTYFSKKD